MSSITIRRCCIGEGRPKVIVPIVECTEAAILQKAAAFSTSSADCVEWRADWFADALDDDALDDDALSRCLRGLRAALGEKLLLVTFRTQAEGGEAALTTDQYAAFCAAVCASGCADLLDIEFFSAGERLPQWIAAAHAAGVKVVCSSHDFQKTPPRAELVERMVRMQQAGADLPKLAVMPVCRTDVLELLAATAEMADRHPETPVITMSMGALGAVSRLCGEAFGSAMTFANPGTASALGQVPQDVVDTVLDSLRL